jgi:WD40 repeat protein/serine/threonine protein kinase
MNYIGPVGERRMPAPSRSLKELFLAALEVAPEDRAAWLERECAADAGLCEHLRLMLAAHDAPQSLLDRPVGYPAASLPREGLGPTVDQPTAEGPGTIIGPYKLLEPIGEGGMGTVWMAQQTEPVKRLVALKLIRVGMDSKQVLARFEAERQALALMDHPNIAKVLDGGTTTAGRPYFVMDLVKGVPITRYCDEHHLTPRQRLELFLPVCAAVQHAHQKGVIHRDLKPSNVLVAPYDGKPVPKVIDFGIAKAAGQTLTEKTLVTGFGALVGTPEYMSPEQAEINQLDIDTRSDIYALGVLLYELLTGTTPFTHQELTQAGVLEMLRVIREKEPSKPSTKLSTAEGLPTLAANRGTEPAKLTKLVRGELDWIVMKALEKDRSRRYQTANGLAMDVQRYLNDEPVLACPPSVGYRFGKFARRNKTVLVTGCLAALAGLAVVALLIGSRFTMQLQVALDQTERARRAEQEQREKAEMFQYFHHIALAHAGWQDGSMARVMPLLEDCPTGLRHWEWRYLHRLCHTDLLTVAHELAFGVAFNPDGTRLASASVDGTVKIWDATTGRDLLTLKGHAGRARHVAFSPDGATLASSGDDRSVRVWDAATGREIFALPGKDHFNGVAFSPDGTRLASGCADSSVKVWDAKTGAEVLTLQGHNDWAHGVVFSPDGTRLASTSGDNTVKVWDATTGRAILTLKGHTGWVLSVAFRPDGTRLASASADNTVKLWDLRTGRETLTCKGHTSDVWCVAFSPDGLRLASCSVDLTVKVWNAATGQLAMTCKGHTDEIVTVAFSPDGTRLASASADGTIRLWDAILAQEASTLRGHGGEVWNATFNPDGTRLASGGTDGTIRVWDATTSQEVLRLGGPGSEVRSVAFSPNGKQIASASKGGSVQLWNATTGQHALTFKGHTSEVWGVTFSPDGKRLASACKDGTVRLWDATSGEELHRLKGTTYWISPVAFSPDGTRLASADEDNTVKLWDVATGQEVLYLRGHIHQVWSVAFSPDGTRLASASSDNTVKIWDLATGRVIHTVKGHASDVFHVAFSPDGARLASAGRDGTVKLWDVAKGQEAFTLRGHAQSVLSVAFSADGTRLASASRDGTVKLWDARPLTPEVAVEREAVGLLEFLFAKPLCRTDVVTHLSTSPTVRPQVRQKALTLVQHYREETAAERFHQVSWSTSLQPHLNAFQYRFALRQAETACRLKPEQGTYLTALGVAQYRAAEWKAAIASLERSMHLRGGGDGKEEFFLSMAHWRLNNKKVARKWYDFAAQWMDKNQPQSQDLRRFRAEAAELLGIEKKKD